ncbi:acyl-CoA thioesterase [Lactiplantibacillus mudanjiangensis]|uniref:Acyl-CoA thioesterase [Lactobacillus allii] n=1 Tax=Lactiplantibacillus mudanjiangensis TaxID=1296538 RepID=A0A660DXW8_9LACO|nr:acyl-CoA thioesterase [Lactiplantibacillus mudanjiangensis]VDG19483.1 acyl-CoA thioesterase [Lactobacillus allii] [Lactiplantibacillus mudanjiangensis]VDG25990.1 acyl-CoA thioesterase [Lactobacillus allii] [Lactiplantibacillus mudanjiangensis]VDG28113.1 acyl-CoA thioesterase [Lactobacillus allii] [Lactiplantibacillus mudanjiangensis]VDG30935.1 acyl-CoA thioesterase [Lactobacillus allii] [Lactiplantibacillus mudanjiangensis]
MAPINVSQTLSVSNHRIFSSDLNEHNTVFGGKILSIIDDNSSIPAARIARIETVTASVDQVNFILPFRLQDSMCTESYVSGVGHRSIEVFTKIIGEHLNTGERFLGLTCFSLFVVTEHDIVLPQVIPDKPEYEFVCQGYAARQAERAAKRQQHAAFNEHISLEFPWNQ